MKVYLLCGPIGVGKSTFAATLAVKTKGRILRTSDQLPGKTRLEKQEQGDIMDKMTNGSWVCKAVMELKPTDESPVIVDSVRHPSQVARIQEKWPKKALVIGLRTKNLASHIEKRQLSVEQTKELIEALRHPNEQGGAAMMNLCDIIFDNSRYSLEDILK